MTEQDRAPGEGFLVQWVSGGSPGDADLHARLSMQGVRVEEISLDGFLPRVNTRAPDLLVLAGEAGSSPDGFVSQLGKTRPGSSIPVVSIGPADRARPRPRSRFGLVARLDQTAEPAALAKQLSSLLRGLSRRVPRWRVKSTTADLPGLARRSAVAGRSGLLAAAGGGAVAIDESGGLAPDPGLFAVAHDADEVLELTLFERAPGFIRVLREVPGREDTVVTIEGSRLLIVDHDQERASLLGDGFAQMGAETRIATVTAQAIHACRSTDPTVIVTTADVLLERAASPLWEEPRFAQSGVLVLDSRALAASSTQLLGAVSNLCASELSLGRRLRKREAVAERLETLGAARWLKLLGSCGHDVTMRVFAAAGRGRVDLADGKIQGASFHPSDDRTPVIEGRAGVEAMLKLPFGRVLAGPPTALAKLDGISRSRMLSIVGEIQSPFYEGGAETDSVAPPRVSADLLPARPSSTERPAGTLSAAAADEADGREDERRAETLPEGAEAPSELAGGRDEPEEPDPPQPDVASGPRGADRSAAQTRDDAALRAIDEEASALWESESDASNRASNPDAPGAGPAEDADRADASAAAVGGRTVQPKARRAGAWPWVAAAVALGVGVAGSAVLFGGPSPGPAPTASRPTGPASGSSPTPPAPSEPELPPVLAIQPGPVERIVAAPAEAAESPGSDDVDAPAAEGSAGTAPAETELGAVETSEVAEEPPPAASDRVTGAEAPTPPTEPAVVADGPAPVGGAHSVGELLEESADAVGDRDYPRAEALAREALQRAPNSSAAAYRLAVALFRQRESDEAIRYCELAHTLDPDDPLPVALHADVEMRRGRFWAALPIYRRALEIEPNFGPAERQIERLRTRGVE